MIKKSGTVRVGAFAFASVLLAACGGGGGSAKADFIKECVADSGQDKATCECQADAMVDALGSDNFSKMATIAKSDEAAATEMMTELVADNPDIAIKMGEAMMKCAGG